MLPKIACKERSSEKENLRRGVEMAENANLETRDSGECHKHMKRSWNPL